MRLTTLLVTSFAFGMLASAPASAQAPQGQPQGTCGQPAPGTCPRQTPTVHNDQLQLDSSFSDFNLRVENLNEASGTAATSGNVLTVGAQGAAGVIVDSTQRNAANTTAQSDMRVGNARGNVINTATATANGLTAGTQGGTLVTDSTQTVDPGTNVTSRSYTNSRNVNGVANTASAAANVASLNATSGGGVNARLTQSSGANIRATAEADHCCVRTLTTATAIASANNVTGTSNGGTANVTTNQRTRGGSVVALVDLYAGNTGDMLATATANGNAVTYGGAHAPLTMNATQDNSSNVQAEAYATVGGEFTGVVSSSSYGVGNSAVGQNSGANGTFNTDQRNSGRVTSYTAVTGNGGVGATGSSTAIGNMASGFVCTACGPATLTANNRQVNNGSITASTTMVAGQTGTVVASATAIGNAATYTIRSGQ